MAESSGAAPVSTMSASIQAPITERDDDDLLTNQEGEVVKIDQPPSYTCWFQHPTVRNNWKVVLGSWALLILGIILISCGFITEFSTKSKQDTDVQSFVFFIAGIICFIPGIYHVVFIYCAVHGWCNFKFTNLSAFQGTTAT